MRGARLWPVPASGPASLCGPILRYDAAREHWESEALALVCGVLLRRDELPDTHDSRLHLAHAFGYELRERERDPGPITAVQQDSA